MEEELKLQEEEEAVVVLLREGEVVVHQTLEGLVLDLVGELEVSWQQQEEPASTVQGLKEVQVRALLAVRVRFLPEGQARV